ncbi:thiopeptide-type bacteriocin biosynthesis protein [Actinomadura chokoriensis]|uniref:Thiopeptide-type bacteriocin biosynthesis protein n=1 Tax=Actinomadura chokoriensis TaxID=454156 RepID=A0ABV4QWU8_9ACTN
MSGLARKPRDAGFALLRVAALSVDELAGVDRARPFVAEAVGVAAGGQLLDRSERDERAARAVGRYVRRMAGRATPFGLFAGTAVVGVGESESLVMAARAEHRARVRVDVGALEKAVKAVLDRCGAVAMQVNPTLCRVPEGYRYMRRDLSTAVVPATDWLDGLALSRGRTLLAAELGELLPERSVAELVRSGLLHPAIDLLGAGCEPSELAVDLLERCGRREEATVLASLESPGLRPIEQGLRADLKRDWRKAGEAIAVLDHHPENERFHLDLELKMVAGRISESLQGRLEGTIRVIESLFPRRNAMTRFRERFRERYEDSEVNLLQAVDFSSGMLAEWIPVRSPIPGMAGVVGPSSGPEAKVDEIAVRALRFWMETGRDFDLAGLPPNERRVSNSIHAAVLDRYEARFTALLLTGHPGAPLSRLARFGLSRPELSTRMDDWLAECRSGDELYVEVVHNPGGHQANVLLRPDMRGERLALRGGTGGTFTLDRLLIRQVDGRFLLRDAVTGCPVVLELNTAHHALLHSTDPFYRLLAQLAGGDPVRWRWGSLGELPHLPRVICGEVIVVPERWRVTAEQVRSDDLRALLPGIGDRRWVGYGDVHQYVPVDLADKESIEDAVEKTAKAGRLDFWELPQMEAPAATSPTGRHVAEIYLPLARVPDEVSPRRAAGRDPAHSKRWLYFKYYCGVVETDELIVEAARLADRLTAEGRVSKWFFVRYQEDGNHLRLRMLVTRPAARTPVMSALDEFGDSALVARTVMDGYVPETTRYGGPANLAKAESLFTADSEDIARLLGAGPGHLERLYRAVADILQWSAVVYEDHDRRLDFYRMCQHDTGWEFNRKGNRVGKFYRGHRVHVDGFLDRYESEEAVLERVRDLNIMDAALLRSLLHMHMNRLFAADPVRLEFLAYELALRKTLELRSRGLE